MGAKRNVDMSATNDKIKVVKTKTTLVNDKTKTQLTKQRRRSKKYQAKRALIDKTKIYSLKQAIELVKKTSYSKFDGTITASLIFKEVGEQAKLSLPHSTGKKIRVAIASDELITQIASGKIEFDVLLAKPEFVPKLAKYARVLGPKGLMPNPKNGTISAHPERRAQELAGGEIVIKTDRKQPLSHIIIGKVSYKTDDLVENLQVLIKTLQNKLVKLTLAASMSPSVKVALDKTD